MTHFKSILTASFAMFSLFLGSGNLVFPLLIGREMEGDYLFAIIGWTITAIIVPLMGLLGVFKWGGEDAYFKPLGPYVTFILTFTLLALIGPFGVIPRCINVSYGGIALITPSIPLWGCSLIFCLIIGALISNENRFIEIIGLLLTPFKLGGVVVLIIVCLIKGGSVHPGTHEIFPTIQRGLSTGYHTMDLLGALFFSGSIVYFFKNKFPNESDPVRFKYGIYASLGAALLLGVIYVGFMRLGAQYAPFLHGIPKESILPVIARQALGPVALPVVSGIIALSCLVTATITAELWTNFAYEKILRKKIPRPLIVLSTIMLAFFLSLLGFEQIMCFLGAILEWIYPILILFALYQLMPNKIRTLFSK